MGRTHGRSRGAGWVVLQVVLGAAVAWTGLRGPVRPSWRTRRRRLGALLVLGGGLLALRSARRLGPALTPLPAPRPGAPLVASGPYRVVRHPVYAGIVSAAAGASLAGSPLAAAPAAALVAVLDAKATREEAWLRAAHPGYVDYARRVRWRFLPGVR